MILILSNNAVRNVKILAGHGRLGMNPHPTKLRPMNRATTLDRCFMHLQNVRQAPLMGLYSIDRGFIPGGPT